LLPGDLLLGYFSSLVLCAVIVLAFRGPVAQRSNRVENDLIAYGGILSKMWGNTTLGNLHNYRVWRAARDSLGHAYYRSANNLIIFKQFGSFRH
jgi:hypothetical protein